MESKKLKFGLIFLLLVSMILNVRVGKAETEQEKDEERTYPPYSALIFLGTGYGWNYYDIKNILEAWNWSITIASTFTNVSGCGNRGERTETCDLTFSQISENTLKNYDCLIIPSGGHWQSLSGSRTGTRLIKAAYDNGLILMAICIGQAVLAESHGILEGKEVAMYGGSYDMVTEAGGIMISKAVVTDGQIVTGGGGGGPNGGGYTRAPTSAACLAMRDAIFEKHLQIRNLKILIAVGAPILLGGIGIFIYLLRTNKISFRKEKK